LRTYFEVSPEHIAYGALVALHQGGEASAEELVQARTALGIDSEAPDPASVEPAESRSETLEKKGDTKE
jgi:pyruvate dehydrogenase complex dehydrogenase (E1) component